MKFSTMLVAALTLTLGGSARAASVIAVPNGNAFAIYLVGGSLNGKFDAVQITANPVGSATFINIDSGLANGLPRGPGEPFTYRNRQIGVDPELATVGDWQVAGVKVFPTEVSYGAVITGGTIDTSTSPGGRLFLANVVPSQPLQVQGSAILVRSAITVATLNLTIVPEPSARLLIAASMACVAAARRGVVRQRR